MGFPHDTICRYQTTVESGGVEALIDANRRKPNIKNRVEEATEVAIVGFALEQSSFCSDVETTRERQYIQLKKLVSSQLKLS